MKPFVHPPKTPELAKRQVEALLWNLHIQGPVDDPKGSAVKMLLDRMEDSGFPMTISGINRIVNSFADTGRKAGVSPYGYTYIKRTMNGKRTYCIELIVDPRKVPFPPNPFKDRPRFKPANLKSKPEPEPETTPAPASAEAEETFARQAQFDGVAPSTNGTAIKEEPVVEVAEPEAEEGVDEVGEVGELEPYVLPVQARNGVNGDADEFDLGDDVLSEFGDVGERSSTELVAAAIGMLSDALAKAADERMAGIGEQIDVRLGEYRILQTRANDLEGKLRHVLAQQQRLVEIARNLRRENESLKRQLVKAKAPA